VFRRAMRAGARHGAELVHVSGQRAGDEDDDPEERLYALCDENADVMVGRICGDLRASQGEEGLAARLDEARLLAAVDRVVDALPQAERDLWRQRFEDEATFDDIAAAFGVSPETAKRRVDQLRVKVRWALQQGGMAERP
jgi:DNA-directed RNA polymerase specialized sigma24 family protein